MNRSKQFEALETASLHDDYDDYIHCYYKCKKNCSYLQLITAK